LQAFLADTTVQTLLKNALDPLPPASAASKAKLETLTAAINITPTKDAPYNIEELKEDAVWLAGEAKFDEVAALRIVVLEWQKHPATRLLSGSYSTDTAAVDDNIFVPTPPPEGQKDAATKSSTQQRRTGLLKLYLSERLHNLKTSELLLRSLGTLRDADQLADARTTTPANVLFHAFCPDHDFSKFLHTCADALQVRVDLMTKGSGWQALLDGESSAEESWLETHIMETITILQLIFDVSVLDTEIPSAKSITTFFHFLEGVNFFAHFADTVSTKDYVNC
jgi:nuclear pore complex protein Nup188